MLTVAPGVSFEVELGSGASTGYTWELLEPHEHIALIGTSFRQPAAATVGDGGTQVFELQAQSPGHHLLHFVRKRRWEAQAIDSRVIEVNAV
ncbi:protease inhibitor I42 family protein [Roseateles oligotrophus]|uniref:Protease inhibitor I42 family protein n=1 Tax=Roseateles oligotrophus TaxID=1769250 RepID=A0ABT2YID4_9BURK|nr:protease inhibitor I42 family protein [Roseateles oligotrophus]MCV2369825.1 protease inhibitor I42 family protein [Roseateles oligotrophus]